MGLEKRSEGGSGGSDAGVEQEGEGGVRVAVAAGVGKGGDEGGEERRGRREREGVEEADDLVGAAGARVGGHEGVVGGGGGRCRHCAGGRRGRA